MIIIALDLSTCAARSRPVGSNPANCLLLLINKKFFFSSFKI